MLYKTGVANKRAVAILFFIDGLAYGTWVAHLPLLKARLFLTDSALGIALLFAAIGSLIALPLAGLWIAKNGSRGIATVSSLAAIPMLILPYAAPNYFTLLAATFTIGVAYSAMDVSLNAQAAVIENATSRPIMSTFYGIFSIGGLVGAIITAIALANGSTALRDTFAVATIGEVVLLGAAIFLISEAPVIKINDEGKRNVNRDTLPTLALLGVVALFGFIGEGALADWGAIYIRTSLAAGFATAAIGFGAFSFAMAIGRFIGDISVSKFGERKVLMAGAFLAAGSLLFAISVQTVWASLIGFALVGLGIANAIPIVLSIASRIRGLAAGVGIAGVSTIGYAGFLVGPTLVGFVSDAVGLRFALSLVALAIAAIALIASRIEYGDVERIGLDHVTGALEPLI